MSDVHERCSCHAVLRDAEQRDACQAKDGDAHPACKSHELLCRQRRVDVWREYAERNQADDAYYGHEDRGDETLQPGRSARLILREVIAPTSSTSSNGSPGFKLPVALVVA